MKNNALQCLPVSTWNKKYLWKQIVIITYTLEKKLFAVATFEGLLVVSFKSKTNCSILGLFDSSLDFQRR